jgi:hypothetical protein
MLLSVFGLIRWSYLPATFQSVLGLVSDQSAGIGVGSFFDAFGDLREPTGRLRFISFFGGMMIQLLCIMWIGIAGDFTPAQLISN